MVKFLNKNTLRGAALVFTSVLMSFWAPVSVYAAKLSDQDYQLFSQNDIMFYDPNGSNSMSSSSCAYSGEGVNYAGETVWNDIQMESVNANQKFYEEAAAEYDFPWQIIAVVHWLESGQSRTNPSRGITGQGVYGLYEQTKGGTTGGALFEDGRKLSDDEFLTQTKMAAQAIAGKGYDLTTDGGIKKVFFSYNGMSQKYKDKAIAMGFSEEEASNGEGSPYVMNKYDARRDPDSSEMDSNWPGRYVADGVYNPEAVTRNYGAFVMYEALAGSLCKVGDGTIAGTAIQLAWGIGVEHDKHDPKPEYLEAMQAVGNYKKPGANVPEGSSCDQFVSTVMRASGSDEGFPTFGPANQARHMDDNPDMYTQISASDISELQPGDILVTYAAMNGGNGNHIYIYVEIDGQPASAQASYGDHTGELSKWASLTENFNGQDRSYKVYRRIKG